MRETIDGVNVRRLATIGRWASRWAFPVVAAREILRLHRESPFDIVHAHRVNAAGLAAAIASRVSGAPVIITAHGSDVLIYGKKMWARPALRFALRRARFTIAVSRELADACMDLGSSPDQLAVWANAVDTERFRSRERNDSLRQKIGFRKSDIVILCLRRLVAKTGVQYLIEAATSVAATIKNVKYLIIGAGPLLNSLEQRASEIGLRDHFVFLGAIPNEVVPDYIAACDIAVFPSLTEATSIACLEVMASGKPVVVSNVGGLPEIVIDGETGLVVDFGLAEGTRYADPGLSETVVEALAYSIIRLARDPALRARIGKAAAQSVQAQWSWQKYSERLEQLYASVCGNGQQGTTP